MRKLIGFVIAVAVVFSAGCKNSERRTAEFVSLDHAAAQEVSDESVVKIGYEFISIEKPPHWFLTQDCINNREEDIIAELMSEDPIEIYEEYVEDDYVEPAIEYIADTYYEEPIAYEPVVEEIEQAVSDTSLGEFRLTAYCSCERCCGSWASNRPIDEYGNPIVYTASGKIARAGYTVAADTSVLPFGTIVMIDGSCYEVQDVGYGVNGNSIDVYFSNHQDALNFGVQYKTVYLP